LSTSLEKDYEEGSWIIAGKSEPYLFLDMLLPLIITACSELHKVLFLALSVTFLCMKYLRNCWTDLRQIHTEDVFGSSLGWVWMSRLKVKCQGHRGQKQHFWPSAACMQFMFG